MNHSTDGVRPLDGVRVLDVGTLTPGKYCACLLASLGADVIRVERPGTAGQPIDDEDLVLNLGKRSMTLNLRSNAGRALFLRLAESADVVLEGNRPGTADRNGFGYAVVQQANERVIYCALSAYGATGPLSQTAGYDLIFLGLSGLLQALTGGAGPPKIPHAYLADGISGLSAAYAIVVALFACERTGSGTYIDLAMLDSTFALLAVSHGVRKNNKHGPKDEDPSPLYDVYAAAEESYLVLGAIRSSSRLALFEHLGRSDLALTTAAESEMRLFLSPMFRTKHADDWVQELSPLDIEIARVNRPDEAFDHPQLRQRGMIGTTSHPDTGQYEFIVPDTFSSGAFQRPSTAPLRIGEHTGEILKSLGVAESRLSTLHDEGVV